MHNRLHMQTGPHALLRQGWSFFFAQLRATTSGKKIQTPHAVRHFCLLFSSCVRMAWESEAQNQIYGQL
jgi:hypothetical protein